MAEKRQSGHDRVGPEGLTKFAYWKRAQRAAPTAGKCSSCGKSGQLIRHHTSGKADKGGTVTLCRSCHLSKHRRNGSV